MIEPIIIIGALRSGTNMLRDMLVELPGLGTWPCDEINYIWRHGNVRYKSDEFLSEMVRDDVKNYIWKQFERIATKQKVETVVEKTCANSLRVGFVNQVFPQAKYIFIIRDGVDATASTLKRWQARINIPYVLRKARYVPPIDLPYYSTRYLLNRLYRLVSKDGRLSFWGVAINNLDTYLNIFSLPEVCALQWKACVENAERDFSLISPDRIYRIKYERFVEEPVLEFDELANFLDIDVPKAVKGHLIRNIYKDSVGKGRASFNDDDTKNINKHISKTLAKYGYA